MVLQCTEQLPCNKPRYCMGVGVAVDLVVCCAMGVDMFDCVFPTRTAVSSCMMSLLLSCIIASSVILQSSEQPSFLFSEY